MPQTIVEKVAIAMYEGREHCYGWEDPEISQTMKNLYVERAKAAIKVIQQEYTLENYLDLWVKHD